MRDVRANTIPVEWISNTLQYKNANKSHEAADQLTADINVESLSPNSSTMRKWTNAMVKQWIADGFQLTVQSYARTSPLDAMVATNCKCRARVVNTPAC